MLKLLILEAIPIAAMHPLTATNAPLQQFHLSKP